MIQLVNDQSIRMIRKSLFLPLLEELSIGALGREAEETNERWSREPKVYVCVGACLPHGSFEREQALDVNSFCYNSKKEHNYFSYPELKAANMSINFKDASHTLQREIVCRLTYTCYITAAPEDTFCRVLLNTLACRTAETPHEKLLRQSAIFPRLCTLQPSLTIRLWHVPATEFHEV